MPSNGHLGGTFFFERETSHLKQQTSQTKALGANAPTLAATLKLEVNELAALHKGLARHMTAWRSAHDTATSRLTAVLSRTDALLERIASQR